MNERGGRGRIAGSPPGIRGSGGRGLRVKLVIDTNIYMNQKGYILPDDAVTLPVTNKSLSLLSVTSIAMVSRI